MIKMSEIQMCQSCGLPFNEEHAHFIAIEPDGSKSIYCTNCYKDGKFIDPDLSMEELIEMVVPIFGKAKSWKDNGANLSRYFKYPEAVRRLIYIINTIQSFNRQLRKVTKNSLDFPPG
jgi:hypothetical protein